MRLPRLLPLCFFALWFAFAPTASVRAGDSVKGIAGSVDYTINGQTVHTVKKNGKTYLGVPKNGKAVTLYYPDGSVMCVLQPGSAMVLGGVDVDFSSNSAGVKVTPRAREDLFVGLSSKSLAVDVYPKTVAGLSRVPVSVQPGKANNLEPLELGGYGTTDGLNVKFVPTSVTFVNTLSLPWSDDNLASDDDRTLISLSN